MIKVLSIFDLMEVDEIKKCIVSGDKEKFNDCLYRLGIDTSKEVTEKNCYHRALLFGNEVKLGILYSGTERTDREYLRNGSSLENRIEQLVGDDEDMADEMKAMSSYPQFSNMIIRHNVGELFVFDEE